MTTLGLDNLPLGLSFWPTSTPVFWPIAAVIVEFAIKLLLIGVILYRRPRSTNLAWIVIILAVPLLGVLAYLLVGESRLGRGRVRRHAAIRARLEDPARVDAELVAARWPELPERFRPIATLAESVGDNGPLGGNRLDLIADTDLFIESLVSDIESAGAHCHLLFYIFLDDSSGRRVAHALATAARRGVACRLLVDAVGSRNFARSTLRKTIESAGVEVVEALPTNLLRLLLARLDLRNHRKIAVIDGRIAYMGSHNIADAAFAIKPRFAPWVDAMVRATGPIAHDLEVLFVEDWYLDTDRNLESVLAVRPPAEPDDVPAQIMSTGPNSHNEAMRQLTLAAFHTAREELILTTPYFVPDEATAAALRSAARRGVETTLVVPARNDSPFVAAASRSHYEPLLAAGVRIFEFQEGLLHAKTLTLDREFALITTANLDRRSFELNFEVSMVVFETDFASQLRFLQTSYIGRSTPVDLDRWRRRAAPVRLWQNAAGLLGPLL